MTSSPPTTVHVGRWGQQRGAAPAPPLDTAIAVSDTLISSLDTVGFSVPRVALVLWHDQQYVWFVPKVAPSKHWVAKILVELLVAHDLADISKKNELELARVHWHAKKNGNHPNKDQSLGHDQNFGKVHFGHNPNTPQHPARRGCMGRRDASAEWCSAANCIL